MHAADGISKLRPAAKSHAAAPDPVHESETEETPGPHQKNSAPGGRFTNSRSQQCGGAIAGCRRQNQGGGSRDPQAGAQKKCDPEAAGAARCSNSRSSPGVGGENGGADPGGHGTGETQTPGGSGSCDQGCEAGSGRRASSDGARCGFTCVPAGAVSIRINCRSAFPGAIQARSCREGNQAGRARQSRTDKAGG